MGNRKYIEINTRWAPMQHVEISGSMEILHVSSPIKNCMNLILNIKVKAGFAF